MTKNWMRVGVMTLLALGVTVGGLLLQGQTTPPPAPRALAVINIVTVFSRLNSKQAGDREIEALGRKLKDEQSAKEKSLDEMKKEMDQYKENSKEYNDLSERILKGVMELQGFMKYRDEKVLMEQRLRTMSIYKQMNEAIEKYSRENGVALVLVVDDPSLGESRSQMEMMQRVAMRKVMYAHESLDITKLIIERMNAEFRPN
ncbi:MAG: OmpH family outer membrane protein [Phycisphaerae bacterium]